MFDSFQRLKYDLIMKIYLFEIEAVEILQVKAYLIIKFSNNF